VLRPYQRANITRKFEISLTARGHNITRILEMTIVRRTAATLAGLGALANEHRLTLFRLLVAKGPKGLSAGEIAERLGIAPSSLTFHIQALTRAGLVVQTRNGRQLIYSADFGAMNALIGFLTENCCRDAGADCSQVCAPSEARQPAARRRRA
jgi:DNA-binding transcriptional ArsR family regulator